MGSLLDFIRILNDVDADLYETNDLGIERTSSYSEIRGISNPECIICCKSEKKKNGDCCVLCIIMLHHLRRDKNVTTGESSIEKEDFENWEKKFQQRREILLDSFCRIMREKNSGHLTISTDAPFSRAHTARPGAAAASASSSADMPISQPYRRRFGTIGSFAASTSSSSLVRLDCPTYLTPPSAAAAAAAAAATTSEASSSSSPTSPQVRKSFGSRRSSKLRSAAAAAATSEDENHENSGDDLKGEPGAPESPDLGRSPTPFESALPITAPRRTVAKRGRRDEDNHEEIKRRRPKKQKNECHIRDCNKPVLSNKTLCIEHKDRKQCPKCLYYPKHLKIEGKLCSNCIPKKKDRVGECQRARCTTDAVAGESLCLACKENVRNCSNCGKYYKYLVKGRKICNTCLPGTSTEGKRSNKKPKKSSDKKSSDIKVSQSGISKKPSREESARNLEEYKKKLLKGEIYENRFENAQIERCMLNKYIWHNMFNRLTDQDMILLKEFCELHKSSCAMMMLCLGAIYLEEHYGGGRDDAFKCYEDVIKHAIKLDSKCSEAYLTLGYFYEKKKRAVSKTKNYEELAFSYYKTAAGLGNAEAMLCLSEFDTANKAHWLIESVKRGHFRAHLELPDEKIIEILNERKKASPDEYKQWVEYLRSSCD
ncbi:MAG: hypothetical protein Hyperionvirus3_65 [Hyperionvirus sp.]|uniref:Uncharacterized protein n=1 Tax=Hyperionvirus sp. TaxID=2487770 RepID=A0A3G5AC71_9VIRU|nr:MAG: hypothetical protein Hyperionvirus3_65 [Hyperionvirus sp.]